MTNQIIPEEYTNDEKDERIVAAAVSQLAADAVQGNRFQADIESGDEPDESDGSDDSDPYDGRFGF